MIRRSNFWWMMAAEEATEPAEDFIQSLSPKQIHRLNDVFTATPDYRLVWVMLCDKKATGELVQKDGWSREDLQQIETETFGIFACALLRALEKRLQEAKSCSER